MLNCSLMMFHNPFLREGFWKKQLVNNHSFRVSKACDYQRFTQQVPSVLLYVVFTSSSGASYTKAQSPAEWLSSCNRV